MEAAPSDGLIPPPLHILSLGAGVQSTTLALLAAEGRLGHLDAAIFADTHWEYPWVYENLDRIEAQLALAGVPLYRVSQGNLRQDVLSGVASIPFYMGNKRMGVRQCTRDYKINPINRKIRELLGANPPRFAKVFPGFTAELWIGFSTDEIGRVGRKKHNNYVTRRYPLLDIEWSRKDCIQYLADRNWTGVGKSSCMGCPFNTNPQWRLVKDSPEWDSVVEVDRHLRETKGRFLHQSLIPLESVNFGEPDVVVDADGCSPYGCRSGAIY